MLAEEGLFAFDAFGYKRTTTADRDSALRCGEEIAVAKLVRCVEEQVGAKPSARNREPRLIKHIAGITRPPGRPNSGTMAKPLHLGREKRIGDAPLRETIVQTWRPDLHRGNQLPTRGNAAEFVEPIAEIPAEFFDGLSAAGDGPSGHRSA